MCLTRMLCQASRLAAPLLARPLHSLRAGPLNARSVAAPAVEGGRTPSFREVGLSEELLEAVRGRRGEPPPVPSHAAPALRWRRWASRCPPRFRLRSSRRCSAGRTTWCSPRILAPARRSPSCSPWCAWPASAPATGAESIPRPQVQRLRALEAESGERVRPKRPRAVVLEPTRELAQQVLGVAKSLCHHARFSSALICGNEK